MGYILVVLENRNTATSHEDNNECPECDGLGEYREVCDCCGGNGISDHEACFDCNGMGNILTDCEYCNGTGTWQAYQLHLELVRQKYFLYQRYHKTDLANIADFWQS